VGELITLIAVVMAGFSDWTGVDHIAAARTSNDECRCPLVGCRDVSNSDGKHVFVSYVHEDSTQVDGLCAVLEAAQIPYWRDRKSLGPVGFQNCRHVVWPAGLRGSVVLVDPAEDRSAFDPLLVRSTRGVWTWRLK